MLNFSEEDLSILHKLWYNRCFSKGRTLYINNLLKGFPTHLKGQLRKAVDKLIRKNILIKIPHRYGFKVYINTDYRNQIFDALKKFYEIV